MTIDEAIAQLENLRKCEIYLWSKDIQAIDIAIKALEENDTLKTEIMALKGGSDVLKICKLEEENAELKKYINQLDKEQKSIDEFAEAVHEEYKREIAELKRLLRMALNDFEFIYDEHSCTGECGECECDTCCPYNMEKNRCLGKWKHAEETLKLIGDDK